jgi:hypothetical protein
MNILEFISAKKNNYTKCTIKAEIVDVYISNKIVISNYAKYVEYVLQFELLYHVLMKMYDDK